jgi:IPT/TIG domain
LGRRRARRRGWAPRPALTCRPGDTGDQQHQHEADVLEQVVEELATLFDREDDGGDVVVGQDHPSGVLGHVGAAKSAAAAARPGHPSTDIASSSPFTMLAPVLEDAPKGRASGGATMAGTSERDTGDRADGRPPPGGPGGENATVRAAVVCGALLALATLLVLYLLVQVWPPAPPPSLSGGGTPTPTTAAVPDTTTPAPQAPATTIVVQAAPNPPVRLFGAELEVSREARLFIVVALAGALGGLVYGLRSLTWYAGNRNLKYSWMMTYYVQPIVGAGLATITYVVLRGGLVVVTTQASPDLVNPFGFAAFGGLVGLFSAEAAEWLKRIFEQVFAPAMKGKDPAIEVRVTGVEPEQGPVGSEVAVTGTGLADVQRVTFGGVEATNLRKVSATELRVTVPDGAVSGPVTVHSPAGTADSPRPFTVRAPDAAEGGG